MFQNLNDSIFDENFSPLKTPKEPPKRIDRQGIKRKFPGPAGLLPKLGSTPVENSKNTVNPCSQSTVSLFSSKQWSVVVSNYPEFVDKYTISWIKTSSKCCKTSCIKATFLAASIQNINMFEGRNAIANVLLKDPTGEISATVTDDTYKKYSSNLQIGAVVVLKQTTVLRSRTDPHLIITLKNLVAIYGQDERVEIQSIDAVTKELSQTKALKPLNSKPSDLKSTKECRLSFQDDLEFTDDFDLDYEQPTVKSQPTMQSAEKTNEDAIWQEVLDGLDPDALLGDF